MFERKTERLLPLPRFLGRMVASLLLSLSVVVVALALGTLGYHRVARLAWIDSFLNASMILTGMGPVDPMRSSAAKLFASGYALFSGFVFLTSVGIVLSPVFHRIVHHFHLDEEDAQADPPPPRGAGAGQRK